LLQNRQRQFTFARATYLTVFCNGHGHTAKSHCRSNFSQPVILAQLATTFESSSHVTRFFRCERAAAIRNQITGVNRNPVIFGRSPMRPMARPRTEDGKPEA
jgi:hypothetical protein